ncbi:MAG: AEC family transporter [Oscillospiraceae bacterium]|nr:AEC family transporter [Oscillospiraceae bacterium]
MLMALTLFDKLVSLFLIIGIGFAVVRIGLLKSEDSRVLSLISLYIVCPVAIMNGFEVDPEPAVMRGMLLATVFAVLTHIVFILLAKLLEKPLKLSVLERMSVIYSNAGMLTIPLVQAMLGSDWVIYTCAYNVVQLILLWTHCRIQISGEKTVDLKKILLNPNIIAIAMGIFIFFTRFRFISPIDSAIDGIAAMIGPFGMLVTGMVIGGMPLKKLFSFKRGWLVIFLRLLAAPAIMVLIAKLTGLASLVENGQTVLLISLLSLAGPTGATVMQMSQIYNSHEVAEYASALNVISMICCAVSMPLVVALYYL